MALSCGLCSAGAAIALIATPVSIPLVLIAGGAMGISVAELVTKH
jgi:hypothetical protein